TVASLMPSSTPTCLFSSPEITNVMTSRSRGVSGRVALPQQPHLGVVTQCGAAPLDGCPDRLQQRDIVDWLGQEFDRASLHRLHDARHVVLAGDENDGHVRSPGQTL